MERILNYTLLENGVTPSEPILAGVQGEHRATALVITPNEEVANAFRDYENAVVLIDSVTAAGEFIKGEERNLSELSKPFYLTSALTVSGLDAIILVRIVLKEANNLKELYKAQIKVCFEQAPFMPDVVFEGKTQGEILSKKAEEVCALIDERAQRAQEIINYKLETVREETTRAANQLKGANQTVAEATEKIAEAKQTLENIEQSASKCNEIENQIEKFILVAEGCKNSALSSAQQAVESRTVAEEIKADCQHISLTVRDNLITSGVNANTANRAATNAKRSEVAAKQSEEFCLNTKNEAAEIADSMREMIVDNSEKWCNALKGRATGDNFLIKDISPINHKVDINLSADSETDLANEKVTILGKNLFSYKDFVEYTNSGIGSFGEENDTYLGEECFSFSQYRETGSHNFTNIKFKENTRYTFTFEYAFKFFSNESYRMPCIRVVYTDGSVFDVSELSYNSKYTKLVFTTAADKSVKAITLSKFGKEVIIYVKKNAQIEEGVVSTEFEEYIEPKEYAADQNGKVEGVLSGSPNMRVITNTGVTATVEYSRDINKAFAELTNAIISLGGKV